MNSTTGFLNRITQTLFVEPFGFNPWLLLMILSIITFPVLAEVKFFILGNITSAKPVVHGSVLDFGGGGTDVDEAIQWTINQVRGCRSCNTKLDVVIIRASGDDGYNQPVSQMKGVNSVQTLVITSKKDANISSVVEKVKNAEVVFFAGGDQCKYVNIFQNTALENAVNTVYQKGGGIGGTSAGAMIQGDFIYNACFGGVESKEALKDPYKNISFTYNFFKWKNLQKTIIDTHFDTRHRMGRMMSFIARQIKDGKSKAVLGIGISEGTSVVLNQNGIAKVMGKGIAYFILGDRTPKICQPHTPLTYLNFKIWKVKPGGSFNLKNRPTTGYVQANVIQGQIKEKRRRTNDK